MTDILIIEDERSIAELEKDYLEMNGLTCDIAGDGKTAFKLLDNHQYRLIILDLMLPDQSGLEISKIISERTDIPVLMVTAKGEDFEKLTGFSHGAADYIVKPFNPNELTARVRAHMNRYDRIKNQSGASAEISLKGVTINHVARTVTVNGLKVEMTAKEYDLLYFLIQHPNHVFTKEELFEKIWGLDALGDNTTVTVHVRKIREKIEQNPSKPKIIQTVWGIGYKLVKDI
ncbi:response regulator transcription factor [Corticicoccus populi]|uniref:Response regulator transcription factor n=1 Tax=Corticicoccus populi TaxID=1812821 RepID=A0ABW5WVT2_9STAP